MIKISTPKEVAIILFFSTAVALIILVISLTIAGKNFTKNNLSEVTDTAQDAYVESRIEEYQRILKDNPKSLEALIELGDVYFDNRNYQEALITFLNAEKIDPENLHIVSDLGLLYLNITDYDNAILNFNKALKIDPTHIASRYYMALTYHYKGDNVKSLQLFEEVKNSGPSQQFLQRVDQEITKIKELLSQQ